MIKRSGGVVAPSELEDAAHAVAGVLLAAAVGVAAAPTAVSERVVVVVEADAAGADGDPIAAGVAEAIRDSLGFSPHDVLIVRPRTIPRTANGKVRYNALKELVAPQPAGGPG